MEDQERYKSIRMLERELDYADNAEERILAILRETSDRSSGSDQLADRIDDWPTTYHLSRRRSNILRPFDITENTQVLEIGAGTGAITRYLGETGARVTALEGSSKRARCTAVRCEDLDNVEVVCGPLGELDEEGRFDLVVVVGVLEYASAVAGGASDPHTFLANASAFLGEHGALALAIENQLGIKYLLGYSEDHLGWPFTGVEGYPGDHGIRTFSRLELQSLLESTGLGAQRWLFPYPDYKLPATILDQQAFELDDTARFVDQLVGGPVQDPAFPRLLFCDDRHTHRVLLNAGLGREIANSFLVLAAATHEDLDRHLDRSSLAWLFGAERRRAFTRHQRVIEEDRGRWVRAARPDGDKTVVEEAWLRQRPEKNAPWVIGPTVEQLFLDACRRHDREGMGAALRLWSAHLRGLEEKPEGACDDTHPFRPWPGRAILPATYLDVSPTNFVLSGDSLEFVDHEWEARGGVDAELVMVRSLWELAQGLVVSGAPSPWSRNLTVNALASELGSQCGVKVDEELLSAFIRAEATLQATVIGGEVESLEKGYAERGALSQSNHELAATLPFTRLHDLVRAQAEDLDVAEQRARELVRVQAEDLDAAEQRVRELVRQAGELEAEKRRMGEESRRYCAAVEQQIDQLHREVENRDAELETVRSHKEELGQVLAKLERHNESLQEQIGLFEDEIHAASEYQQHLEHEHRREKNRREELDTELAEMRLQLEQISSELEIHRQWRQAFEGRLWVRAVRALKHLVKGPSPGR